MTDHKALEDSLGDPEKDRIVETYLKKLIESSIVCLKQPTKTVLAVKKEEEEEERK